MNLTVIGTGYLGATHAAAMAQLGHDVLGVDVDTDKVARLNAGDVPFFEPGLPQLLRTGLDSGRLRFTSSYEEAGDFGDVHFVCVGTPQKKGEYAADLTYVEAAMTALVAVIRPGAVVAGKSTVPSAPRPDWPCGCRARALNWCGTRNSSARASRWKTPCIPTESSSALRVTGR